MKKEFLVLAVVLLCVGCSKSDENEPLTGYPEMSDPDDVCTAMDDIEFMKYCYEHFDVNKDGKVSPVEAQAVTTIGFGNSTTSISGILTKVKSLKGIQHFTNLTSLECNCCFIQSLDVSKNLKLTSLKCNNCGLKDLDVSKNKNLTHLECGNLLIIDGNNNDIIDEEDLEYMNTIRELNLSNNKSLQQLIFKNLWFISSIDLSNNQELKKLDCEQASISTLNISKCPKLVELNCGLTDIHILDISNNFELENINCNYSKITSLDISNNQKLKSLSCSYTAISTLDISNCLQIEKVYCYDCSLSSITMKRSQDRYKIFGYVSVGNVYYID